MKILHVIPFITPRRGGSVTAASLISKELSRRGHDVTIATTDFELDSDFVNTLQEHGVHVEVFSYAINIGLFLYSPSIKKWFRTNSKRFDLIHLHNYRTYQNIPVARHTYKTGIPYVLQSHGSIPAISEKTWLKTLYDVIWGRSILNRACRVVAVSEIEKRQCFSAGIPDERIEVVPNGVDIERFTSLPPRGQFRKRIGIDQSTRVVLYLGRVHRIKGLGFLVKSFAYLMELDPDIDLLLVIAGPDDGYLRELTTLTNTLGLSSRVRFIEETANIAELYRDADLFVSPSEYEIFGLTPYEALLCGTPALVSKSCGCSSFLDETGYGYSVRYGDIEELGSTMREIIKNPDQYKRLAELAAKHIITHMTWGKATSRMEGIYEDCVRHS